MKGIVFTEFMQMIEDKFGDDMVDDLIDATEPESDGAYTAVGTYEFQELVNYIVELGNRTGVAVPDLIKTFGLHLGEVFTTKFSDFFTDCSGTIELLKQVHDHIHVEVQKLYPDAELPDFSYSDGEDNKFYLYYRSKRGLADLAEGLIESTMGYYQEDFSVERSDAMDGEFHTAEFTLTAN